MFYSKSKITVLVVFLVYTFSTDIAWAIAPLREWTGICLKLFSPAVTQDAPVIIDRPEVFEVLGGLIRYDVQKAYQLIREKKINAPLRTLNIVDYAETGLGLNRLHRGSQKSLVEVRPGKFKTISMKMKINFEYAGRLSPQELERPGLVIEYRKGSLVIDGLHRMTKLYYDGQEMMDFFIVAEEDAEQFKLLPEISGDEG